MLKEKWKYIGVVIVMVLLAANTPAMQGTGRYEVYNLVKTELNNFEKILEEDIPVTDSDYDLILKKFKPYDQNYQSEKEIVMVRIIKSLYYMRSQETNPYTSKDSVEDYKIWIQESLEDLKMHLNEYEKMNSIPRQ